MAIDTITPAAASLVEPGDSFSFTVDNTYTTMTIEAETAGGWEYAYDGTLGGAQAGYTVSVTVSGGRHIFVVTRDAGWNLSPTSIRVIEDETGASATTTTNYVLATATSYPQTATPYYINPSMTNAKFTDLLDTPAAYTGAGLQTVRVNAAGTALEFAGGGGGGGVTDHGALTGLADDDHTQYVLGAGTRAQDAALFTERADHVNTPATGKGEIWVKNDAPNVPMFTDDDGTDIKLLPTFVHHEAGVYNASFGTTVWVGPPNGTLWQTGARGQSFGTGTDPAGQEYEVGMAVPVDCKVRRLECWYRVNTATVQGELAWYRHRWTSGSATVASALVGSCAVASGGTAAFAYDASIDVDIDLLQGDRLGLYYRSAGSPTSGDTIYFTSTVMMERQA